MSSSVTFSPRIEHAETGWKIVRTAKPENTNQELQAMLARYQEKFGSL